MNKENISLYIDFTNLNPCIFIQRIMKFNVCCNRDKKMFGIFRKCSGQLSIDLDEIDLFRFYLYFSIVYFNFSYEMYVFEIIVITQLFLLIEFFEYINFLVIYE